MSTLVERGGRVTPQEIADLREAVGWDRAEATQQRVLDGSYCYYVVRDGKSLAGFLNVVSDGVADALLVNVVIHPRSQGNGLGRALVRRAVDDVTAAGIQCIQVTFLPELEGFYRKCGFHILGGAVIDRTVPGKTVGADPRSGEPEV